MKKEDYVKAIDELLNSYDAYYFINKYDDENNTHKEEFELLIDLLKDDETSMKAINWIKNCYDCYYKEDYVDDKTSAFSYLKMMIDLNFDPFYGLEIDDDMLPF